MSSVNRRYRRQIEALQRNIEEHEQKIALERTMPLPDEGRIRHWLAEIRAWREIIVRRERRLRRS